MGCVWGIGGSVSGGGDSAAFCSSQGRVPGTGPCPGVDPRGVPTRRPVVWGPLCSGARRLGMEEPALKGIPGECPGGGSPALAPALSHLPKHRCFPHARSLSRGLGSGTRRLRSPQHESVAVLPRGASVAGGHLGPASRGSPPAVRRPPRSAGTETWFSVEISCGSSARRC